MPALIMNLRLKFSFTNIKEKFAHKCLWLFHKPTRVCNAIQHDIQRVQ